MQERTEPARLRHRRMVTATAAAVCALLAVGAIALRHTRARTKEQNSAEVPPTAKDAPRLQRPTTGTEQAPTPVDSGIEGMSDEAWIADQLNTALARELTCLVPGIKKGAEGMVSGDVVEFPATSHQDGLVTVFGARALKRGAGTLHLDGFEPLRLAWSKARDGSWDCSIDGELVSAASSTVVYGRVTLSDQPVVGAVVSGCGSTEVADEDGSFVLYRFEPGPCVIRADHALLSGHNAEALVPESAGDMEVELVAEAELLLIGIILPGNHLAGAWEIASVVPGGPAELAGIQPGNRISQVDGVLIDQTHPMELLGPNAPVEVSVGLEGGDTLLLERVPARDLFDDADELEAVLRHRANGWVY